MTAEEIKNIFTLKQLQSYNSEIRSKYNHLSFEYSQLKSKFEIRLESAVKERTSELENK